MYRAGLIKGVKSTTTKSKQSKLILPAARSSIRRQYHPQQQQQRYSSVSAAPPSILRKQVTPKERAALRAARKEKAARVLQSLGGSSGSSTAASAEGGAAATGAAAVSSTASSSSSGLFKFDVTRLTWYLGLGLPTFLIGWGIYDENSPPAKLSEMIGLTNFIGGFTEEFAKPSREKLLPDWHQVPNVPKDMPCPHTLVLDLENTLVSATWDRRYGWRYAKRPGVDKFLHDLAQYYEIVLYSPSIEGIADPVVTSLDKNGCILHRLYRDATYYINGVHCKDLNSLNRNTNRIIILDDEPEEVQLTPENLIRIKPYDDPNDRDDDTLSRITPFLIEIAHENYDDIPGLLRQFQGMDADEIANEYERRISSIKAEREAQARRGLGALAGGRGNRELPAPELPPEAPKTTGSIQPITSKDLVGEAPPKEQSGVIGWLNKRQKENAEEQMRKMEKWNEVMLKRQQEKKEKEMNQAEGVA